MGFKQRGRVLVAVDTNTIVVVAGVANALVLHYVVYYMDGIV